MCKDGRNPQTIFVRNHNLKKSIAEVKNKDIFFTLDYEKVLWVTLCIGPFTCIKNRVT